MRIEEYLISKLVSERIVLSEEDMKFIASYLSPFEGEELDMLILSCYDFGKLRELTDEHRLEAPPGDYELVKALITLQFIQVLRDNRELIRDVLAGKEFNPNLP